MSEAKTKAKKDKAEEKKDEAPAKRPRIKTDPKKVKAGHVMALVDFVVVEKIGPGRRADMEMDVTNLVADAPSFKIEGATLIANAMSADLYEEEEKITGTEAENKFGTAYNKPFTVCFVKQGDKGTGEGAGEERVLRGRLLERDGWRGRSLCEDFDVVIEGRKSGQKPYALRWVDHRTIKWFILDNVRFTIK